MNGHRPLEKRFGIGVAALILVETGQVFQDTREVRMVRAERLFEGGHRPLEKPLGIGVTALSYINGGQIVQRLRNIRMVGTERFLGHRYDRLSSRSASA